MRYANIKRLAVALGFGLIVRRIGRKRKNEDDIGSG